MAVILVVDDEEKIAGMLESFFSKMGFGVIRAVGGERGVEALRSDAPIDILIVDMKMPVVEGRDVLSVLAATGRKIPVIVLTGSIGTEEYLRDLQKMGYAEEDVCYKPVDLFELLGKVKKKLNIA